ncbi:hypothetical protein RDV84_08025 [Lysobacter yananisis]|uniref:Uncharacterized protein n=1 Tax=Lysobacter yananisis TaxID=1003114 RepID=A0ABY9PCI2_9GAMM|nr:hypothetical protein [Lysobacter yananisis]WMT04773.1 hypothetical protein RDV84_08025 [Lysobacter yananisis]
MTLLHFPANRLRPQPGKAPYRAIAPLLRLACAQLRERDAADARGALVATWRRSPQSGRLECRWTRAGAAEEPPGRERMDRRDRRDRRSDRRAHRDAHPLRRSEACPDVPSLPAISAGAAARALVAQRL